VGKEVTELRILEDGGIGDEGANNVWVDVGCWSSVFDVSLALRVGS